MIRGPHNADDNDIAMHCAESLEDAGWNSDLVEALAANGHDAESAKKLSSHEAFGLYLHFNGIIGYTSDIIDALDNCRNMGAL